MARKRSSHRKAWTDIEDQAIIKYAHKSTAHIAKGINRTPAAVSVRKSYLKKQGLISSATAEDASVKEVPKYDGKRIIMHLKGNITVNHTTKDIYVEDGTAEIIIE